MTNSLANHLANHTVEVNYRNQLRETAEDGQFREDLVRLMPHVRAFGRGLCRDRDLADDLAQETFAKAWEARARFTPGTNLKAWLFTILKNNFCSNRRRSWREAPLSDAIIDTRVTSDHEQYSAVQLGELAAALKCIPPDQYEALLLVSGAGVSYEAAADICQCAVGTVKSRVSRARKSLNEALDGEGGYGPLHGSAAGLIADIDRLVHKHAAHAGH